MSTLGNGLTRPPVLRLHVRLQLLARNQHVRLQLLAHSCNCWPATRNQHIWRLHLRLQMRLQLWARIHHLWCCLRLHLRLHLHIRCLLVVLWLRPQRRILHQAAAHLFLDNARRQQLRYGRLWQQHVIAGPVIMHWPHQGGWRPVPPGRRPLSPLHVILGMLLNTRRLGGC